MSKANNQRMIRSAVLLCLLSGPAVADQVEVPCATELQCRAGWEAARHWVLDHSDFKVRIATDDLLETYEPTNANPFAFAARLIKEHSRILANIYCGAEVNVPTGGLLYHPKAKPCQPDGPTVREHFKAIVESAIELAQ